MTLKDCLPRTDWLVIGIGLLLMFTGGALTLTWVGAIVGIPMFLGAVELFANPKTVRGAQCA